MSQQIAGAAVKEPCAPASPTSSTSGPQRRPLSSSPPGNAAVPKKRRQEQINAARSFVKALCFDAVIERFAEAGYGYVDVVGHVSNIITEAAETLVVKKVIECVFNSDSQSCFQVFTETGEHLHEPLHGGNPLAIVSHLRDCSEAAVLSFECPVIGRKGWVKFVWGNDPSEVICDYSNGSWLEETIKPAQEFAAKLEGSDTLHDHSGLGWREAAGEASGGVRRYGVRY